jgi:hypothetical protein
MTGHRPRLPDGYPRFVGPGDLVSGDRVVTVEHAAGATAMVIPVGADEREADARVDAIAGLVILLDGAVRYWVMTDDNELVAT